MIIHGDRGEDGGQQQDLAGAAGTSTSTSTAAEAPSPRSPPFSPSLDAEDSPAAAAREERFMCLAVRPLHPSSSSAAAASAPPLLRLEGFRALDTVALVKARAAAASLRRGDGSLAPAATLTLVFNGKVLSDDSATLAAEGITGSAPSSSSSASPSSPPPPSHVLIGVQTRTKPLPATPPSQEDRRRQQEELLQRPRTRSLAPTHMALTTTTQQAWLLPRPS